MLFYFLLNFLFYETFTLVLKVTKKAKKIFGGVGLFIREEVNEGNFDVLFFQKIFSFQCNSLTILSHLCKSYTESK